MAGLLAALRLSVLLQALLQDAMVHGQAPRACPDVCSCIGLTDTMDCTPRPDVTGTDFKFTTIPQLGPLDTRVIIMSGNLLSSLPPDSLSAYPSLETLVLNDNLFTEVPSEGFFNLTITNLTFDGNPLTDINAAAFSNITTLRHLAIRRTTSLNFVAGGQVFDGLDNLISLSLDDNMLEDLPSDFLTSIPQLQELSLRNNNLQTLPMGLLDPLTLSEMQIDLSLNPWSCDCFLQWLRVTLDSVAILVDDMNTVCHWPPAHNNPRTRISQVAADDYQCYEPTVTQNPTNSTFLSNVTLTIPCGVNSAPFPEVTWTKDGEVINYTSTMYVSRYDASLRFEGQGVDDTGDYQCFLENVNGTAESSVASILILESTCFDNSLTRSNLIRSNETDLDCGGQFCMPCNITQACLLDRDCEGDLVCLYAHSLPSSLQYISPSHPDAYTCDEPSVPPLLLEALLQNTLPLNISLAGVSALADSATLQSALHDYLALQLEVSRSTISNVRVSSIEKTSRPLIQVWFDLPKTSLLGMQADNKLMSQVNDGDLLATVRRREEENFISYRLNL